MIKNTDPLVSIITPSLNCGQYIEETINSVLNQSYSNIEYIIVDGLSTDNTKKILKKYEKQIHKIIFKKDKSMYEAIDHGFRISNGEILSLTGFGRHRRSLDQYFACSRQESEQHLPGRRVVG